MKKILVIYIVLFFFLTIGCFKKNNTHDLSGYLAKTKQSLIDSFGEPTQSEPYGKTIRMGYNGEFASIKGIWSYYILPDKDYIVSSGFTAKGQHQDALSQAMVQNLGEALTVKQLTEKISTEDHMGQMASEQIIQNYENGMRVWINKDQDITYFLNVESGENSGYDDSLITSVVSIQDYKKRDENKKETRS